MKLQSAKFKNTLFKYLTFLKMCVIHQNKALLLVNPAKVSDFKKALQRKHTMRLSENNASRQVITNINQPFRGVTKVRNNDTIYHLPLMIFEWLHSQDSMLHNKCLFCSIKPLFCWCVLFSNPLEQSTVTTKCQMYHKSS